MKKILTLFGTALAVLFLCPQAKADSGHIVVDTILPVNNPATYSSTWSVRTDGINWASAETVITSATVAAGTFTDGSASSATITVSNFASLSTATATGQFNVSSNSVVGLPGACVSGGGPNLGSFNVCNPAQWAIGAVSSNTAFNIATAINNTGVIVATSGVGSNGIVYASAPVTGTQYNLFTIASSTENLITVTTLVSSNVVPGIGLGTFTGGQNAATLTVNGTVLQANRDWYPVTSNGQTATNLAAAILNSSVTTGVTANAGLASVIFATSTSVGSNTTYLLQVSSFAALTLSAPFQKDSSSTTGSDTMVGGTNAAYTINTPTITLVGNGFSSGMAVLYTTSTGVNLAPLIWGVTYYIVDLPPPGPSSQFGLGTTSSSSVAGLDIVFTSSRTNVPADSFVLTPTVPAGAYGAKWVVSNDNTNWIPYTTTPFNITIPSVLSTTYYSTGTVTAYDFGHMDYGYLGLSVQAPGGGGSLNVTAHIIGNAP